MNEKVSKIYQEVKQNGPYYLIREYVSDEDVAELIDSFMRTAVCSLSVEYYELWKPAAIQNWLDIMSEKYSHKDDSK